MTTAPPRFTLHPACLLFFAFAVGMLIWKQSYLGGSVDAAGMFVGGLIALLIFPLVLGLIAYWIGRRSARVGNITVCIVLLLLGAGQLRAAVLTRRNATVGQAGLRDVQDLNRQATRAQREGDHEAALDATETAAQRLEKAAGESAGSQKAVLNFTAEVLRRRTDLSRDYLAAIEAFRGAGGAQAAGAAQDRKVIEDRLGLLDKAAKAHDILLEDLTGLPQRARDSMRASGVPDHQIEAYISAVQADPKFRAGTQMQNMEHDILDLAKRRLGIMLKNHGRWTADASGELDAGAEFPPDDLEELSRIDASIDRISQAQKSLLQQSTAP